MRRQREPGPGFIILVLALTMAIGIPGLSLMEAASRGGARAVMERLRAWGVGWRNPMWNRFHTPWFHRSKKPVWNRFHIGRVEPVPHGTETAVKATSYARHQFRAVNGSTSVPLGSFGAVFRLFPRMENEARSTRI